MSWSRSYSRKNTALLRKLIAKRRIIVDGINGQVLQPNGKPYATEHNWCGYARFRVQLPVKGKSTNKWFFVHKAVMLSEGLKLKKHYEINHIDHNPKNNRRSNLEYIHRKANAAHKAPDTHEPVF